MFTYRGISIARYNMLPNTLAQSDKLYELQQTKMQVIIKCAYIIMPFHCMLYVNCTTF